jgi:hypothetical protein
MTFQVTALLSCGKMGRDCNASEELIRPPDYSWRISK